MTQHPIRGFIRLYRYSELHYGVDCELCNGKITNMDPNTMTGEILDRINAHIRAKHPDVESE